MLDIYTNTPTTVLSGANIPFNSIYIKTRCSSSTITAGDTGISLNEYGYYNITFNASAVESGTVGNIVVNLEYNGNPMSGKTTQAYSGATTDIVALPMDTIVQVACLPSSNVPNIPAIITFNNAGVGATYQNVEVTVEKVRCY